MNKFLLLSTVFLLASGAGAQSETPAECPVLPDEGPTVALPEFGPIPTPRPQVQAPKPPSLPVDLEVPETGVSLLDRALAGKEPRSVLPFWFGYPWGDVKTPILWTAYLSESLQTHGKDLLHSRPQDAELFCPNYANLQEEERLAFWIRLISAVMEQESTYRPTRTYHSVRVQYGLFSVGLMMLSLPSAQQSRFGCSMIAGQDDLFDWRKNIDCALRIMSYYFREDQVIAGHSGARWMGIARYWEPFRDSRLKTEGGRATILRTVKQSRLDWLEEARADVHPARRDGYHKARSENPFLRVLRITNQMAFCPSGSPNDYEKPEPWPAVINPPVPTPRPLDPVVSLPDQAPVPAPKPKAPEVPVVPPHCPPLRR